LPVFAPAVEVLFPTAEKVPKKAVPNSQARIKNIRVPSSLVINVAAAELANDKSIHSDILSESLPINDSLFCLLRWGRVNQKLKSKCGLDFDVDPPLPSDQAEA